MFELTENEMKLLNQKFDGEVKYKKRNLLECLFIPFLRIFQAVVRTGSSTLKSNDIIFFMLSSNAGRMRCSREEIVKQFNFSESFQIITLSDLNICVLDAVIMWMFVFKYYFLYLISNKEFKTNFHTCFIPYIHAKIAILCFKKYKNNSKLFIYGNSFFIINFFLSCFAKKLDIFTTCYVSAPAITNSDTLIADEVITSNPWYSFPNYVTSQIFPGAKIIGGKTEYYALVPDCTSKKSKSKKIAIYSGAMYKRIEVGLHQDMLAQEMFQNEERMKFVLVEYAIKHPNLKFTIFPHPMENIEESLMFWKELVSFDNVELLDPKIQSCNSYNEYEIGISTQSNTLFERLEKGHKSIFLFPSSYFKPLIKTPLNKILIFEENHVFEKIESLRNMSNINFLSKINVNN